MWKEFVKSQGQKTFETRNGMHFCTMKNQARWGLHGLIFLFSCLLPACSPGVSEEQFVKTFKELSDLRIEFRKNMKALGDSSFSHRKYSREVVAAAKPDPELESVIKEEYKAYNDSLRSQLAGNLAFFEDQYVRNKPIIGIWEKREMHLDKMVEKMKSGDLNEKDGLDSMKAVQTELKAFIHRSDSLVKLSTERYWKFRNTWMEYQYNQANLSRLYANEWFSIRKRAEKKAGN